MLCFDNEVIRDIGLSAHGDWLVHSCLALAGSTRRYSSAVLTLTYPEGDWINQISEKGQSKVIFIREVHYGQIWSLKSEQFGRVSNTTTIEEEPCWTLVWDRHKKLKPHIYNVLYEFGGFSSGLRGRKYPSRKGISKIFATWKMERRERKSAFSVGQPDWHRKSCFLPSFFSAKSHRNAWNVL